MNKVCSKCKESKILDDYYTDIRKKDGKTSECKSCHNVMTQNYRAENRQQILESKKKFYSKNKQKIAEYNKKYRVENKQRIADHKKQYMKIYCFENKQRRREYQQKYYTENKQRKQEYQAKYQKTEKGKLTIARGNYNKKNWKSKTLNDLTIKESNCILFLQNYRCANPNCKHGRFFDNLEPTIDHIHPLSKGGPLSKNNVQFLCQSCNSSKNIKYIDYRSENHKQTITTIN